MSDLREIARTARTYVLSRDMTPVEAWDEAARRGGAKNAGYARTTFLGLCEAGLVKGVPAGEYAARGGDMRQYAVRMIELLVEDDLYEDDPQELFVDATKGKVGENGQIDVVFGLWNHGLIDTGALAATATGGSTSERSSP